MTNSRIGCLLLFLLLVATVAEPFPQARTDDYKPLFQNRDFKVYAVRNPDALPSISDWSNFGVLVLKGDSTSWTEKPCSLCFSGPTGARYSLAYGTPGGVVTFAEKHSGSQVPPIWIAVRPDAVITEQLFNKDLPEDFSDSVHADLFAIGSIADRAAVGAPPSEKEQARASAALRDLDRKAKWFSLFKDSEKAPPPFITVKVHTVSVKSGKEKMKWTVSYVLDGWEGDKDHTYTFDHKSSPTEQPIVPGSYRMWASRGAKHGSTKTVAVGDTPTLTKELELEIP